MKIEEWNALEKTADTECIAAPDDLCTVIDGVAFLIQRKNEWNNVICQRIDKTNKRSLIKTFNRFRIFCHKNKIRYIRVAGGVEDKSHAYSILKLMQRTSPKSCGLVLHKKESEELGINVFYVKTY